MAQVSTNSDPKVVARYYLEQVEAVGGRCQRQVCIVRLSGLVLLHAGCLRVVRCDYGTENISIASSQMAFQFYHTDSHAGESSFIYGPFIANIVNQYATCACNNICTCLIMTL